MRREAFTPTPSPHADVGELFFTDANPSQVGSFGAKPPEARSVPEASGMEQVVGLFRYEAVDKVGKSFGSDGRSGRAAGTPSSAAWATVRGP